MKITNLERLFITITSLVINKILLFALFGASHMFVMLAIFVLLIFNFMILAKSVDKLIDAYEQLRKKQTRPSIDM